MYLLKIIAVILIVVGVFGLVYGKFSFAKQGHDTRLGPVKLSVKETQAVNIPVWAGISAIAVGGLLLLI